MTEAVLACAGLQKRYGDRVAVDGITFEIHKGETFGLLGPNGAGKTTTVSMVCGLLAPDAGHITVAGISMNGGNPKAKTAVGYVPQEVALYPDLSGRENLAFFGRLYGLRGKPLRERVSEALEAVGLTDRADDRVSKYSGGMRRRVNIAAGLLHRPLLLVLDEPTVGVDPQSRNAILEHVAELARSGMAVLYTTHYMEEAERLCDRVGIVDNGRLVATGTRRELVQSIGAVDRIDVQATGQLEELAAAAKEMDGVEEAAVTESGLRLVAPAGRRLLPALFERAAAVDVHVASVEVIEPDLEAVFLHLTGRALRD